jgi:hypothetical protein
MASAVALAAVTLDPARPAEPASVVLARSAALGAAAAALAAVAATAPLGAGLGVAVLALATGAAVRLLARITRAGAGARVAVLALVGLAATVPLWLGPAVDTPGGARLAAALVAASPLTYLAVLCDVDYLRAEWFYARTPVSQIRFTYPAPAAATLGYCALGGLLLAADRALSRRWR